MPGKSLAVVTGASAGIGAAIAHALAARGMDLIVISRRVNRLNALKTQIAEKFGTTVKVIAGDLTHAGTLLDVEEKLRQLPIDLLVNSAGFGTYAGFAGVDAARLKDELTLDLIVPIALTRAVLPSMLARNTGVILNVSSMAGFIPIPRHATYCAAKAGLTRFTEALHGELAGTNVRVQAVCPGPVPTEFFGISGYRIEDVPRAMMQPVEDLVRAVMRTLETKKVVYVPDVVINMFVGALRLLPLGLKSSILGGGPGWFRRKRIGLDGRGVRA